MADLLKDIEKALNLSHLQIEILYWLHRETKWAEKEYGEVNHWGILWTFTQKKRFKKHSDQSISRSLLRLETRGLLVRNNHLTNRVRTCNSDSSPSRTTCVRLTVAGRELTEFMTRLKSAYLNHHG
jgi:hypothetical protein